MIDNISAPQNCVNHFTSILYSSCPESLLIFWFCYAAFLALSHQILYSIPPSIGAVNKMVHLPNNKCVKAAHSTNLSLSHIKYQNQNRGTNVPSNIALIKPPPLSHPLSVATPGRHSPPQS